MFDTDDGNDAVIYDKIVQYAHTNNPCFGGNGKYGRKKEKDKNDKERKNEKDKDCKKLSTYGCD